MKARLKIVDAEKQLDFVEASQEFLKRANKIGTYAATMKDAVANVSTLRRKSNMLLRMTHGGVEIKLDAEDQKAMNSAILTYFLEKAQAAHIKLLQAKDEL